jgi:hypothetical protein
VQAAGGAVGIDFIVWSVAEAVVGAVLGGVCRCAVGGARGARSAKEWAETIGQSAVWRTVWFLVRVLVYDLFRGLSWTVHPSLSVSVSFLSLRFVTAATVFIFLFQRFWLHFSLHFSFMYKIHDCPWPKPSRSYTHKDPRRPPPRTLARP